MKKSSTSSPSTHYELATHSVKVRRSGTMMNVSTLSELLGIPSLPGSLGNSESGDTEAQARFLRLMSVDTFNQVNISE